MPGTFVQDSLAPNILAGATLNSATTSNGSVVDLSAEAVDTLWELRLSTVESTGNSATLTVHIYGSAVVGMTNPTRIASFVVTGTDAAQSNKVLRLDSMNDTYERFIRATVITGGTAPVYTGATLKPHTKHFRRTKTDSASIA